VKGQADGVRAASERRIAEYRGNQALSDAGSQQPDRGEVKRAGDELEKLRIGDLVFTGPTGRGLWPPQVTATFQKTALEFGWPTIGVHGLGHSSASCLIGAGVSPKVVLQRLGHSSPNITLPLYAHVIPGPDQAAAAALDALDSSQDFRNQNVATEAV
jgi:integrase